MIIQRSGNWLFLRAWPHTTQVFFGNITPSWPHLLRRKARPQHREFRVQLLAISVWAAIYEQGLCDGTSGL